jgi:hypothetical protein
MNEERIKQIIDDIALNRYDSIEKAINDLIEAGVNPDVAKTTVLTMDQIDVVP